MQPYDNTLQGAYTGQSKLAEATQAAEQSRNRLRALIDAKQKYAQFAHDEAQALDQERAKQARNPASGIIGMTAAGSKFGPIGAAAGAAIGSVGAVGKDHERLTKQMKEEGRSKGWRRKKMVDKWINPITGLKNLFSMFQNNPQAAISAVGSIGQNLENFGSKVDTSMARDSMEINDLKNQLAEVSLRDRMFSEIDNKQHQTGGTLAGPSMGGMRAHSGTSYPQPTKKTRVLKTSLDK